MPKTKVMNKVPDRMLQKLLQDEKAYLPVAITTTPKRSIVGSDVQPLTVSEKDNEFFKPSILDSDGRQIKNRRSQLTGQNGRDNLFQGQPQLKQ